MLIYIEEYLKNFSWFFPIFGPFWQFLRQIYCSVISLLRMKSDTKSISFFFSFFFFFLKVYAFHFKYKLTVCYLILKNNDLLSKNSIQVDELVCFITSLAVLRYPYYWIIAQFLKTGTSDICYFLVSNFPTLCFLVEKLHLHFISYWNKQKNVSLSSIILNCR